MWLSEEIATSGKDMFQPRLGHVVKTNKDKVTVKADGDYNDVAVINVNNIESMPTVGDEVVVFPVGDSAVCSTLTSRHSSVQEGEIYISNDNGAYIWLKNDGTIVINGQVFNKEE